MRAFKFVCLMFSSLFSASALAGGVTGGTGIQTNFGARSTFTGGATGGFPGQTIASNFRQILLDSANFKVLEIQSLRGLPVNLEGESHLVDSMDLENRTIVLNPESGLGDSLKVTEAETLSD